MLTWLLQSLVFAATMQLLPETQTERLPGSRIIMPRYQQTFRRRIARLKNRLLMVAACPVLIAGLSISAVSQQPAAQEPSAQVGSPAPQQPSPQPGSPAPASPAPDPFYAPITHPNESRFLLHLAEDRKGHLDQSLPPEARGFQVAGSGSGYHHGIVGYGSPRVPTPCAWAIQRLEDGVDVGRRIGDGQMTGVAYIWGRITHDERMRETGVLATEAMLANALGVDLRSRPARGVCARSRPTTRTFSYTEALPFPPITRL